MTQLITDRTLPRPRTAEKPITNKSLHQYCSSSTRGSSSSRWHSSVLIHHMITLTQLSLTREITRHDRHCTLHTMSSQSVIHQHQRHLTKLIWCTHTHTHTHHPHSHFPPLLTVVLAPQPPSPYSISWISAKTLCSTSKQHCFSAPENHIIQWDDVEGVFEVDISNPTTHCLVAFNAITNVSNKMRR